MRALLLGVVLWAMVGAVACAGSSACPHDAGAADDRGSVRTDAGRGDGEDGGGADGGGADGGRSDAGSGLAGLTGPTSCGTVGIEPGIVLRPRHLAAADFDGDGRDDVAVAQGSAVHVLISRGDGTCEAARTIAVTGTSIVSGDFDGDARADLAIADWELGQYAVIRGTGDGAFLPALITTGASPLIATADFDGDGRDDLADERAVSLTAADGAFRSTVPLPEAPALPGEASDVIAADVDGDGSADLLVASEDQVAWYRGNGDGTFDAAVRPVLWFLPGTADGAFARARDVRMGAASARGFGVVVGDFDGDDRPDLAYAEGSEVNLLSSAPR
jgi:hypothetical protein